MESSQTTNDRPKRKSSVKPTKIAPIKVSEISASVLSLFSPDERPLLVDYLIEKASNRDLVDFYMTRCRSQKKIDELAEKLRHRSDDVRNPFVDN